MAPTLPIILQQAMALYQQYGRPLEREHTGKYVAISTEGNTLIGSDLDTLIEQASIRLGPGNVICKFGAFVVGN